MREKFPFSHRAATYAYILFVFIGSAAAAPVAMLTFHNDNTRQGANTNESMLTRANVNSTHFGKLFSYSVDGYVYAQPLIMTNVAVPGKGPHNVVFVATEHNSIYAFDADSNSGTDGGVIWQTHPGMAAPMSPEYGARFHREGNTDLVPEAGITGTPVIDPTSGTIYVDVFSHQGANFFHHIHALDIATGTERPNSPLLVSASVPGTGVDSVNGVVEFNAKQHLQRPALTLAGGILFVAYGSHADTDPYHGWIIGFDAAHLQALPNYVFNTTPNARTPPFPTHAGEGALWMGGNGLVVDAHTNLFFEVANGSFSANTNGGDYGDSFVKLSTANKLAVSDYFTPFDQEAMQAADSDLGSGGPMLLPDSAGSAEHPHLIVGAGKPGIIHLVDCDNMGGFNSANDGQIVQEVPGAIRGGGSYATPAYFNHHIYYTGKTDNVKAFAIADGVITPRPSSRSPTSLGPFTGSPVISADGINNGIVWVIDPGAYNKKGPAVLHAYNADNLAEELYNSSQNLARDNPGGAVKMTSPTVANGKVYVGAEYKLSVYGARVFVDTPVMSPNGGPFTNRTVVSLTNASLGAQIYYSLDGAAPTTNSILYNGPFELGETAMVQAIAVKTGAVDSQIASASFMNTAAPGNGTGLTGEYFRNPTGANPFVGSPDFTRTDPTVDFNWDSNAPDAGWERTNFTVRWTGSVQARYTEMYTFAITADHARLYVNGRLLMDNWSDRASPVTRGKAIAFAAQQFYNIELDYYQKSGRGPVKLAWSSRSTPPIIIPRSQLYPQTNPPPTISLLSPADDSAYTASASVTMSAKADALHNQIDNVTFYAGRKLFGSVSQPPYTITATGLGAGNYRLTAVATDKSGMSNTSAVNFKVAKGSGRPYGLSTRGTAPAFLNMPHTFNSTLPPLISMTGIFSNTPAMTPASGLVPYDPNTPLWADGAFATCFLAVPKSDEVITPDQQISFSPTGNWTFRAGTVFVKTLELNTDRTHPKIKRRLETQVLVRDINGHAYGATYKWRTDNRDADLLVTSVSENIAITNSTGLSDQAWYYASPAECLICHTPAANYVLGVNTRQLNGSRVFSTTGVRDNQLRTLNHLGLLNPAIDESTLPRLEKLSALMNPLASIEERARSYLDANCAGCHRPGGYGSFDVRYETPLMQQHIVNAVAGFNLGYDHSHIITPGDLNRSVLYDRMNTLSPGVKMPLLGHNLIDSNAVGVMAAWIKNMPPTPEIPISGKTIGNTNSYE